MAAPMNILGGQNPKGPSGLMDSAALQQWILRRLGAPLVKVELTDDDLTDAVEDASRWFTAKKGYKDFVMAPLLANTVDYQLPDFIDTVIDITFTDTSISIQKLVDPMALIDGLIPANVLGGGLGGLGGWGNGGGMLSAYAQTIQYLRLAREVLNGDYEWRQDGRVLRVFPSTMNSGSMLIEYKASKFTVEQLNERDHDLLKRWALADAREKLGTVRSKLASYFGATGGVNLDGVAQVTRAVQDKEDLDKELAQSGFPLGVAIY